MITEETKAKIAQYEDLKIRIKKLEDEADLLKPAILAGIPHDVKLESDAGVLSVSSRPTWKFSETVESMKERLEEQIKMEKADGTAEEIPGVPFLVFKVAK